MSTPRKPDLEQLVTALTADGRPAELAGRDAVLAAFRGAGHRDAAKGSERLRRGLSLRRPVAGLPTRLAVAGAALVVVVAGGATAAYTQALPGPAQHLAHTVFAPLGVPDHRASAGSGPGTGSTGVTTATSGGKSKAPSPRPAGEYRITVAMSQSRVLAGEAVSFTGRVTDRDGAARRTRVRLYERPAGTTQFTLVDTRLTGPRGGFRLLSPPLTATATFRVVGPGGAHSVAVKVMVVPGITTHATSLPNAAPTGR